MAVPGAAGSTVEFLHSIRVPIVAAMIWAVVPFVAPKVVAVLLPYAILDLPVRIALVAGAGYLATRRAGLALWGAAVAGAVVFLASHVVVKGGIYLAQGNVDAALGVVISFFVLVWIAMGAGLVGGWIGKERK
jgi:hypothetical protein